MKLTVKKIREFRMQNSRFSCFLEKLDPRSIFCLKPSPDQDGTNKKRIFQIGLSVPEKIGFKQTLLHRSQCYIQEIYKHLYIIYIYIICIYNIFIYTYFCVYFVYIIYIIYRGRCLKQQSSLDKVVYGMSLGHQYSWI